MVIQFLKSYPRWIQNHYTEGFYNAYYNFIHSIFSFVPFSFGDLLYLLIIILLIKEIYKIVKNKFRLKWDMLFRTVGFVSLGYFLFHLSWGLNYYKLPLHLDLKMDGDYSTQQLINFTEELLLKSNTIHCQITTDTTAVAFDQPVEVYKKQIFKDFGDISFTTNTINALNAKPSLISLPLTYMGFGGYINPFTLEAQYNYMVPSYKFPTLIAHEMGHQLGLAKENEANFIACYVNMKSENVTHKYAGYSYALRFCLNEVYRRSPEDFKRLRGMINPGILSNFYQIQQFWESYENPIEPFFKLFYGNFLKVNNQPQGIESYNYVVALLVNYYSKNSLP
jgi:hypothetical protein